MNDSHRMHITQVSDCRELYQQQRLTDMILFVRGAFKKFAEKCCQIDNFHGKSTLSVHVVNKHINICTKMNRIG